MSEAVRNRLLRGRAPAAEHLEGEELRLWVAERDRLHRRVRELTLAMNREVDTYNRELLQFERRSARADYWAHTGELCPP